MLTHERDGQFGADLLRVFRDDGRSDPSTDPRLPREALLGMYRAMLRIRVLDARMIALHRQGRIGFYGACLGQEAVPVATAYALDRDDWIFPALRESAILLLRGFPLDRYIAQVFGTEGDVLKGRQMPSHMAAREANVVSWSSCIATQLPHAVGAAWAAAKQGDARVTVGFVGEGGTSHPDFHAAMTFAGVFRVPCVIVCQNNHWAISTPSRRQTASESFAAKARAYGMPGLRVDGNDVLAVHRAVSEAAGRARAGGGPTFLECVTYRMGPHSTSDDPTRYQPAADVAAWAARDPISRLRVHLRHLQVDIDALDARILEEMHEDVRRALAEVERQGAPAPDTLFDDVYAERPWPLEEQRAALARSGRRAGPL